jgi:uncharacterized membrane protein YccF (DUF307 family)
MLVLNILLIIIGTFITTYLLGTLFRVIRVFSHPYDSLSYDDKHYKIKVAFFISRYLKINVKLK